MHHYFIIAPFNTAANMYQPRIQLLLPIWPISHSTKLNQFTPFTSSTITSALFTSFTPIKQMQPINLMPNLYPYPYSSLFRLKSCYYFVTRQEGLVFETWPEPSKWQPKDIELSVSCDRDTAKVNFDLTHLKESRWLEVLTPIFIYSEDMVSKIAKLSNSL